MHTEFYLLIGAFAGAAIAWMLMRSELRALTEEIRGINGDPALRDRDIFFDDVLARVNRTMDDPVSAARAENHAQHAPV